MQGTPQLQPVIDGLAFAEAPRWHGGKLWFSDMYTHSVHYLKPDGQLTTVAEVPGKPSGLGWLPDGRLLVVSMAERKLLRLEAQGLVEHADLSQLAGFDCNDMVVDIQGRAYVGNLGFDVFGGAAMQPTALVMVTPDGQARTVADGLLFPNGAVITPDGKTLIIAETFGYRLTAFDVAADGSLNGRRSWAELGGVMPDGICLDAEGAIWAGSPLTSEFVRIREGCEITDRIACTQPAIACALGGADGRTLYMVSGPTTRPEEALAARAGRIDSIRVRVPAAGLPSAARAV